MLTGLTATDSEVASMLLKAGKKVVLCVNKVDRPGDVPVDFYEFYNLGLGDPIAVSSAHGLGIGDLLDAVYDKLEEIEPEPEYDSDTVKVAVIGKPNAGKSSLYYLPTNGHDCMNGQSRIRYLHRSWSGPSSRLRSPK